MFYLINLVKNKERILISQYLIECNISLFPKQFCGSHSKPIDHSVNTFSLDQAGTAYSTLIVMNYNTFILIPKSVFYSESDYISVIPFSSIGESLAEKHFDDYWMELSVITKNKNYNVSFQQIYQFL